jgi:hypothetical protein
VFKGGESVSQIVSVESFPSYGTLSDDSSRQILFVISGFISANFSGSGLNS